MNTLILAILLTVATLVIGALAYLPRQHNDTLSMLYIIFSIFTAAMWIGTILGTIF